MRCILNFFSKPVLKENELWAGCVMESHNKIMINRFYANKKR